MDKTYRTVKSSKFTGTVKRKEVATVVRNLLKGRDGVVRDRQIAGGSLDSKTKKSASAGGHWRKP